MRRRLVLAITALVFAMVLVPLSVAAATNQEIIAVLKEVIRGILDAGRDAYCASGVTALCK